MHRKGVLYSKISKKITEYFPKYGKLFLLGNLDVISERQTVFLDCSEDYIFCNVYFYFFLFNNREKRYIMNVSNQGSAIMNDLPKRERK